MKKILTLLLILLLSLGLLYSVRFEAERWTFEKLLNLGTRELFQDSLRLKGGFMDRSFKIHLNQLEGTLVHESGPVAIEMKTLDSENSLFDYFSPKGLSLKFQGLKPKAALSAGISGRAELRSEKGGSFRLESSIDGLDLSEVEWLNPANLKGSSGAFTGSLISNGKFTENPELQVVLISKDGLVQSKFFGMLLPYLPALPTKERMATLAQEGAVVPFQDAAIRIELPAPNKMKIVLHIKIPDYNIELNINFEIRLEEKISFLQLIQTFGLVKVKNEK